MNAGGHVAKLYSNSQLTLTSFLMLVWLMDNLKWDGIDT